MTFLITGGTGFIGRNLVEYFKTRVPVLAPSRQQLDLLDEDAVAAYFRNHEIDVVVHSATTPGHRNAAPVPDLVARNLRIFWNIVRQRSHFRRMIYLGSGAVYDMRYYQPKMTEEYFDAHVPADPHGFSKYLIARHVESLDQVIELRLFGVFGRYEDWQIRFISNAICKALFGLPITLRQNRNFDYVYIDDLARIVEQFVHGRVNHKAYNVTPSETLSLLDLARIVKDVSGASVEILVGQEGTGLEYSGSNARLYQEFPQTSFTPVWSAIQALYQWYSENRQYVDPKLLLVDK